MSVNLSYTEETPIRESKIGNKCDFWISIDTYNKLYKYEKNTLYYDKDGNLLTGHIENDNIKIDNGNLLKNNNGVKIPLYLNSYGKASENLNERNFYISFEKLIIPIIIISIIISIFINKGWTIWLISIPYLIYGFWRKYSIIEYEKRKVEEWDRRK